MSSLRHRLSDSLVKQRIATRGQLDDAAKDAARTSRSFARILVERGILSTAQLTEFLSRELGLPVISLSKYRVDVKLAQFVPERVARQYQVVPLSKLGNRLVVAMADPLDVFALDDLRAVTQLVIDPVLSSENEIARAIEQIYSRRTGKEILPEASPPEEAEEDQNINTAVALLLTEDSEGDAPVVKVINLIIVEALRRRASDIHLEPLEDGVRVRFRIDGQLVEGHRLPKTIQGKLLTRLKIMSGMDITESRIPQDGRFRVRLAEREVDFRVSVLPLTQGGKVVLRLLDRASLSVGLDNLGFLPESTTLFNRALSRPFGMILITGPTGSGKSTTLYSVLNKLNDPERNLITIEDPVEYQLEGITQVQVNPEVGLTFASGLRALLRQSPDIVMIGEIRDFETADIAMKASLTGQLVLSTLHTNDAPSAVTRLVDMGVEEFLVASSVSLIEAQRLVRKLCTECRKSIDPPKELLRKLQYAPGSEANFYAAVGCRQCRGVGFKGRLGILEVCEIDERIRELVVTRAPSWKIKDYAVQECGMRTMSDDGLKKAEMGLTTVEEVLMVTRED